MLRIAPFKDDKSQFHYPLLIMHENLYRNDPKFSDRQAWANSADPDQTAPRGAV